MQIESADIINKGIPVSTSLNSFLEKQQVEFAGKAEKKRLLAISALAVVIGSIMCFVAKFLVYLINFFTNISFYQRWSVHEVSPAGNALGIMVIVIPVIGGIIVGLMAFYGSKAIRGHGIPEAMEQVLTNNSKIKPVIMILKPLSAAISIGTGGPFGAEGPIIATGGALGSTLGQLIKITHQERKVLLASGAAAGMAAIFGSPVAAIFLCIELLLFEFSPRSIIPVTLACITGAAGHHFLFETAPVFAMAPQAVPGNVALAVYSFMGVFIGFAAMAVTKTVYFIEDTFEKLPVHWMWWPALGGIAVGIAGFFFPRSLGVGYNNISDMISGHLSMQVILYLCIFKFFSWAISLSSGTSGGTLAPLLTIGGAFGALTGYIFLAVFPDSGITIPMAALIGMSGMFAGASRALLTSIVFALETTGQFSAFLPLLGACTASYAVSFFLMENTIMTEKIARRGVKTPHSYEPDLLEKTLVSQAMTKETMIFYSEEVIGSLREKLKVKKDMSGNYFLIRDTKDSFIGIVSYENIFNVSYSEQSPVEILIKKPPLIVAGDDTLKMAAEMMARENADAVAVISHNSKEVTGILSYRQIMNTYNVSSEQHKIFDPAISMKRRWFKKSSEGHMKDKNPVF